MRNSAAGAYLAVGAVAAVVYVAVDGDRVLYEAFGLSAVVAIVAGVRMHRPRARAAWLTIAAAQALLFSADVLYFTVYSGRPPYPGLPDVLYLVGDVVFLAGLILLLRGHGGSFVGYIDAVVATLATGLIIWTIFFDDVTFVGTLAARLVSIGYPVLDLALLVGLVRILLANGAKTRSYALLLAGVVVLILGDAWYVVPVLTSHYEFGTWRDLGWLASYVLVGASALHPSMTRFVDGRDGDVPLRRVGALVCSLAIVVVGPAVQLFFEGNVHVYVYAAVGAAMAAVVALRVALLIRQLERTRAAAEQSERKFRMVFERAPIGISIGRDGMMSETNPALQRMLGYSPTELPGLHYLDITHPDDRELALQQELDERTRHAFAVDKRYLRKDGSSVDAHVHVALDLDDGLGISLIEDVSERRALEDQLRHSQKMDAVGKLAGGIAHDFNNLMTAVIGYSDLLLRDASLSAAQSGRVDAIRDAATRASDLTRQLLAFSRRQVLQASDVDLREVVIKMDELLRRLIGEDIRYETIFGSEDVVVRADRSQLEQVVLNLVVNARDAVSPGGSITVAVLSAGDEAVLAVSDDGAGIDAEVRSHIFEPFFTTKGLAEGSGLGLATVHGIVGQSGGTIEVESTPGAGSVFTVRLPLAAATARPDFDEEPLSSPMTAATLVD